MNNIFDQAPFQCRMDWGIKGVKEAAKRKDIIVLVDILSFSTTVTVAVQHGALVYPFEKTKDPNSFSKSINAQIIYSGAEGNSLGIVSKSPSSFNKSHMGKKFVMPSTNGSTCAKLCSKVPALLIGCFLNAGEVAKVANTIQNESNANVTVIACGEKWNTRKTDPEQLRPCIEDYLGAGAILSALKGTKSPEAMVCINGFKNSKKSLRKLIWDCVSGRELRQKGRRKDVRYATQMNCTPTVPILNQENQNYVFFSNKRI